MADEKQTQENEARTFTRDDVAKMISAQRQEWEEEQEEAKRLARMSAEEKRKHEVKKLQDEIQSLKAERQRSEMTTTARQMLSDASISVPDELLGMLVGEGKDADATKQAVDAFVQVFNERVEDQVAERLKGKTPKGSPSPNKSLTKEQIMAIKDRSERQRLIAENPGLFGYQTQ